MLDVDCWFNLEHSALRCVSIQEKSQKGAELAQLLSQLMWNSWAEALLDDVRSSQEKDDNEVIQVREADELRSPTSDDSDTEPSESDDSLWWVNRLMDASRRLNISGVIENAKAQAFLRRGHLQVLSCCTGCCAESEVLKAGWAGV